MEQPRDLTLAQALGKLDNLELIVIKLSRVAPNTYELKRDAILLREKIIEVVTIIMTQRYSKQELGQFYDEQKSQVVNWKNKLKTIDPEVLIKLLSSTNEHVGVNGHSGERSSQTQEAMARSESLNPGQETEQRQQATAAGEAYASTSTYTTHRSQWQKKQDEIARWEQKREEEERKGDPRYPLNPNPDGRP